MTIRLPARFVFLALLFFGAVTETTYAGEAGLEGVISVSPARPGPLRKGAPDKAPAANTPFVVYKGETKVASFTTDAAGHFHLALPPGHYIISREDPGAAIGHWRFEVDVTAGEMAKVAWIGDSGMR